MAFQKPNSFTFSCTKRRASRLQSLAKGKSFIGKRIINFDLL